MMIAISSLRDHHQPNVSDSWKNIVTFEMKSLSAGFIVRIVCSLLNEESGECSFLNEESGDDGRNP